MDRKSIDENGNKCLIVTTDCLVDSNTGKPFTFSIPDPEGNGDPRICDPILNQPMRLSEWRRAARDSGKALLDMLSGKTDFV